MNKNKIAFLVVILIFFVFTLPKALSKIEQIYVRYNYDEPYEILDSVPEDVKVRFNNFIHK